MVSSKYKEHRHQIYNKTQAWNKIAASVLLKLVINCDERCQTTDAPLANGRNSILKCKQDTL